MNEQPGSDCPYTSATTMASDSEANDTDAAMATAHLAVGTDAPGVTTQVSAGNGATDQLTQLILAVLGSRRVAVLLSDPSNGILTPAASVGLAPAEERRWRNRLGGGAFADLLPNAALRDRVATGESLALNVRAAVAGDHADALALFGARVVVVAPMRVGGRMIGLLLIGADADEDQTTGVSAVGANGPGDASKSSGVADAAEDAEGRRPGAAEDACPSATLALADAVARMAALALDRERLIQERAEERAEERAQRIALSDANERMDEFLAIASHELKSPLTTIKGNVQLANRRIRRLLLSGGAGAPATPTTRPGPTADANAPSGAPDPGTDDQRALAIELLQRTEQQITRLNRLVDDLLDTSRIQAGKLELRQAPCDLARLAREVVEEQRQSQPTRALSLDAPDQPVMIHADADRVRQVIINYITNALKYSPADRPVAVKLVLASGRARLAVRDHGPGLPLAEQSLIWERFHRAPGVEQQGGQGVGLGLGLHISRTLIERQGGMVGVESAVGQGSTFWFTLPLLRSAGGR